MKHVIAALGISILATLLAPAGFANQTSNLPISPSTKADTANSPLTIEQIVVEFTRLPLETQKLLMKILMSDNSDHEKQATTQELDTIYATLPMDIQRSLYVRWDALSDEQRMALRQMDPAMMKSVLGAAVLGEISRGASHVLTPIKEVVAQGTSLARASRAYVQKLLGAETREAALVD